MISVIFTKKSIDSKVTSLNPPINVRFNDATRATAAATVRWRLAKNQKDMIRIHKEYKLAIKLVETTLTTYTDEYGAQDLIDLLMVKTAKDLAIDLDVKRQ